MGTPQPLRLEGFLYKQGNDLIKAWRKRWFVLRDTKLSYYKQQHDDAPISTIDLEQVSLQWPHDENENEAAAKSGGFRFELVSPGRTYYLMASSKTERRRWFRGIQRVLGDELSPSEDESLAAMPQQQQDTVTQAVDVQHRPSFVSRLKDTFTPSSWTRPSVSQHEDKIEEEEPNRLSVASSRPGSSSVGSPHSSIFTKWRRDRASTDRSQVSANASQFTRSEYDDGDHWKALYEAEKAQRLKVERMNEALSDEIDRLTAAPAKLSLLSQDPGSLMAGYTEEDVIRLQRLIQGWLRRRRFINVARTVMDSPVAQVKLHRTEVLSDLIESERSYIRHLKHLLQYFMHPIRAASQSKKQILSAEDTLDIFQNVEVFLNIHRTFARRVEEVLEDSPNGPISDLLEDLASHIQEYEDYTTGYPNAVLKLRESMEHNVRLKTFIQQCEQNPFSGKMRLGAYLFIPISHLTRLVQLLENLQECTPSDHSDTKGLPSVLTTFSSSSAYDVESPSRQKATNLRKLLSVEVSVSGAPTTYVQRGRCFVREGIVSYKDVDQTNSKGQPRYLFLFNDLLLSTILVMDASQPFAYCESYPVKKASVHIFSANEGEQMAFKITCSDGQKAVFACDEANEWIEALQLVARGADTAPTLAPGGGSKRRSRSLYPQSASVPDLPSKSRSATDASRLEVEKKRGRLGTIVGISHIGDLTEELEKDETIVSIPQPELLRGESLIWRSEDTATCKPDLDDESPSLRGVFFLTNYRLFFVPVDEKGQKMVVNTFTWALFRIPLSVIDSVQKVGSAKKSKEFALVVTAKDFRTLKFQFTHDSETRKQLHLLLTKFDFACFAFDYHLDNRSGASIDGWSVYSPHLEFGRQGIPNRKWRMSDANSSFHLSPTYPRLLVVPQTFTDSDLASVAKFRTRGRIPTLSWKAPDRDVCICRCSQPRVGFLGSRNSEDELMVSSILRTCPEASELVIIDCRPRVNAMGNQMAGAGFENTQNYKNTSLHFMNIENIHVMRESLHKFRELLAGCVGGKEDHPHFWSSLDHTGWFGHMRTIMSAVGFATKTITEGNPVLIHCSDGWDRTAQISALSQLVLDPYYRTLKGFQVLIEKEWISFGHKFAERLGHGEINSDSSQKSPVFLQFVETVWQMTQMYPRSFQFNDNLLVLLVDASYSCRFGTFLFNNDQERYMEQVRDTPSLWSHVNSSTHLYKNNMYIADNRMLQLFHGPWEMRLWDRYYLRWMCPESLRNRYDCRDIGQAMRVKRAVRQEPSYQTRMSAHRRGTDVTLPTTVCEEDEDTATDSNHSEEGDRSSDSDKEEDDAATGSDGHGRFESVISLGSNLGFREEQSHPRFDSVITIGCEMELLGAEGAASSSSTLDNHRGSIVSVGSSFMKMLEEEEKATVAAERKKSELKSVGQAFPPITEDDGDGDGVGVGGADGDGDVHDDGGDGDVHDDGGDGGDNHPRGRSATGALDPPPITVTDDGDENS